MDKDRTESDQIVVLPPATRGRKGWRAIRRLWREDTAATSVEYAVMLALILGVILISVKLVGNNANQMWTSNSSQLSAAGLGS